MSKEKQIEEMARMTKEHCQLDNGCGSCHWSTCNECLAEVLYNAGYRKQEWISVDERLPENSKIVFAYDDDEQGILPAYRLDGNWVVQYAGWDVIYLWQVTHWMPLPELPKMKGGE